VKRLEDSELRTNHPESKKLAEDKLARGENADEFVKIGEADGFKIHVTAGKTAKKTDSGSFHQNPRDVFMLVLQGELELAFENGEKVIAKAGEYFVLPKQVRHQCSF
jgi:quercetin dioxygenase-like cupin family protein